MDLNNLKLDHEKLAEVAMAILALNLFDDYKTWKSMDWDILDNLYEKGWIGNPVNKNKSVSFSEEGKELAFEFLKKHFEIKPS